MTDQHRLLTKLKDKVEQAQRDSIEYKMRVKSAAERLQEEFDISVETEEDAKKRKTQLEVEIQRQTTRLNVLLEKAQKLIEGTEEKIRDR